MAREAGFKLGGNRIYIVNNVTLRQLGPVEISACAAQLCDEPTITAINAGFEEKRAGSEADHSPPPSVDVKNDGALPPLPHMSSWHGV
jgi:hypothetical protein